IGNDVKIIGSISIGDGAVVGAGAIVTHDVEPYEVVAGIPAKRISYRFSEEIRKRLLEEKWWEWPEERIKEDSAGFYLVGR
ncbi:MAG: antibiotic acetyltransferase, partial [Candidatus Micrarchaeota archaeon]|nr:antibiotic acetyltransferase [Candidatus Micrarchaeota archaeon]